MGRICIIDLNFLLKVFSNLTFFVQNITILEAFTNYFNFVKGSCRKVSKANI